MKANSFLNMLLDVDMSSDICLPKDNLWVTARWQNLGGKSADRNLRMFMDLEFGYQRIREDEPKNYRCIMEHLPDFRRLAPTQIMPVTLRYKLPEMWPGTYHVFLGICDDNGNPIEFIGKNGAKTFREKIGCIEVATVWGRPAIDLIKKAWTVHFNDALPKLSETIDNDLIEISDKIEVRLYKNIPAVRAYRSGAFEAEFETHIPEVIIRHYETDTVYSSTQEEVRTIFSVVDLTDKSAAYNVDVFVCGQPAVHFRVVFEINEYVLRIHYDEYVEKNGFEFIETRFYSLAALGGSDSYLVNLWGGGRLTHIKSARQIGYVHSYDIRNTAALYNKNGLIALEAFSLDDKLYQSIEGENEVKRGVLGATLSARVLAHNNVKSIKCPESCIEIAVFNNATSRCDWLGYAKYLRRTLKSKNNHIHKNALHIEMYSSQGPEPFAWQVNEDSPYEIARKNQGIRLDKLVDEIEKIHNILDGYKQVTFLYGYHKQNNEEHIPSWQPYEPDRRAGTPDAFRQAVVDAKKFNCDLCLYENYDHVYTHGIVDAKFAAVDMNGDPWKGWVWADGIGSEVGYRKYVESGELQKRIKKMIEVWGTRVTGYVDVLSSEVLRWDFDPSAPSSAQTSLKYRQELIHEYNRNGMDVFSESLTDPWVGVQSYAHSARIDHFGSLFQTDTYIPMISAVYHGIIGYNTAFSNRTMFLKRLKDAGGFCLSVDKPVDNSWVKWVYLYQFTVGLLFDEQIEDISCNGDNYTISYTNNSSINIDERNMKYSIVYQGRTVGKNWTSFVKSTKGDGWLAYSYDGGQMEYDLPSEAGERQKPIGRVLTFEGVSEEQVNCAIVRDKIVIDMPKDRPVKITFLNYAM